MKPQQLKAMKLALEALELLTDTEQTFGALDYGDNAITALEEALKEHAMRETQRLGQEIEQDTCAMECQIKPHASDCAVHSEPAYPKGECDCGGIVAVADYTALSDKYVALSDKYVALKAQHKEQPAQQYVSQTDKLVDAYCEAWGQSFTADSPYHTVMVTADDRKHIEAGLKAALAEHPAQRTEQEPDDIASILACRDMLDAQPVPPRTWVGLTDEDMYVVSEEESCSFIAGAKWSEAILKEKNT